MDATELHRNLTNQSVSGTQVDRIEVLRNAARDLGDEILEHCPPSREQSLAITNLEQALMWAVASIAREGGPS
jgi:hypothetical protein